MFDGRSIEIRYVGPRFEGGQIPVEILSDLLAFRDLLLAYAKVRWRAANPTRTRLPRGFDRSISFDLAAISKGSAVAKLNLRPQSKQDSLPGFDETGQLVAASCQEVLSFIDGAEKLEMRDALSSEKARAFNRFGSGLTDNERIEFNGFEGTDGKVIYLNQHRRRMLITSSRGSYQIRVDGTGSLSLLDAEGFIGVRTDTYGIVSIPLDPERVKEEFNFNDSLGAQVQFSLLIELDSNDKIRSVVDAYEVELIDQERSDRVMSCKDTLAKLRYLKDGWLDGVGVPPTDPAITSAEYFLKERPSLADKFRIYPLEVGGVAIEFEHEGWGLSLEFDPDGSVELFGVEIDGSGEVEPKKFDCVDTQFFKEFDSYTSR